MDDTALGGTLRDFPQTHWTLVLSAREGTAPRRKALEHLLTDYWKPLYFCTRCTGRSSEDATRGSTPRMD